MLYIRNTHIFDKCCDKKESRYWEEKMGTDILGKITMEDSSEEVTFE